VGPTKSLGKVARERIPGELSPSNYPGRHVARDEYPHRHVAREGVEMSLGIVAQSLSIISKDSGGAVWRRENAAAATIVAAFGTD
ncbi:hypothetical protein Tco_0948739, partial [Tanacetum coccineum]